MSAPALPALGDRSLLFVHLPKTGGTSVADLLGTRFAPEETLSLRTLTFAEADATLMQPDRFRFVHGHLPYTAGAIFRTPPFILTILRDPVERSVSAYYFLRQTAEPAPGSPAETPDRMAAARLATQVSLEEFARSPLGRKHVGDRQVKLLSESYAPGYFGRRGTSNVVPDEGHLETALGNLQRCDMVGVTERLQESVELLSHCLGGALVGTVGTANATLDRLPLAELGATTVEALQEATRLDRTLYRAAAELFEQRRRNMLRTLLAATANTRRAALASEFGFDAVIPGDGWYTPERDGNGWYSWTGPATSAWLDIGTPPHPPDATPTLRIEVAHTVLHDPFDGLVLRVNGHHIEWAVAAGPGRTQLHASLPAGVLRPTGEANRVELTVRATARPCEVWPANPDTRPVGIAIGRVELR